MKFHEFIEECIKSGEEFDAIIGDCDMPATFGFTDDLVLTPYCYEKYGDLLNADCKVTTSEEYTTVCEVFYDDENIGERFTWAVAGYIAEEEFNKLFHPEGWVDPFE